MQHSNASGASIERSVELEAGRGEVWRRITEGRALSDWMGGVVTIDPRPGGRVTLHEDGAPLVWGTVEDVVDGRRIQWTWRTDDGLPTMVEFEIDPIETRTRLTVRETLLPWTVSGPEVNNLWGGSTLAQGSVFLAA